MSDVCGRPIASCIWKALGFVLRLIHTDYAKYYIAGHWKTGPKGLPAWGATPPPHTHTLEKHVGRDWVSVPTGSRHLWTSQKHLTDWFNRSQYFGIVWVKEKGSWRDLGICARSKRGGWRPPSAPLPWEVRGGATAPLPPLFLYAYVPASQITMACVLERF